MPKQNKYTILKIMKLTMIVLLVITIIWLVIAGWHLYKLVSLASDANAIISGNTENFETSTAIELVHHVTYHLSTFESTFRITYPLFRGLSRFPYIGNYACQVEPLLKFSSNSASAIDLIAQSLAPGFIQNTFSEDSPNSLQRILTLLNSEQTNIQLAIQEIQQADQARSEVDPAFLPAFIRSKYLLLDSKFYLIKAGISSLAELPELLGADKPYTYLILAQNRDELRPTGGFISGVGTMVIDQGKITHFNLGDSYRIDDFSKPYPAPPEPLQRLMLAGYWVTRDANWSPDFPTSARQTQSLYTLSTDQETNAVIAFDQKTVSSIFEELGPLHLESIPGPITSSNVENYMLQSWAPNPSIGLTLEWWEHRKDFMGQLGRAIIQRVLETHDPIEMMKVAKRVVDLIETGHVLVYFSQPEIQDLLVKSGLDHSLHVGTGDYLMLVDTNFGFNKADSMIKRSLEYKLDLSNLDQPRATIRVRYENTVTKEIPCKHESTYGEGTVEDMRNRCYWDYWRVYTPPNRMLVGSLVEPIPGNLLLDKTPWNKVEEYPGEEGTNVFAGVVVVPTRSSVKFSIDLSLPEEVLQIHENKFHYSLYLQKQPGVNRLPFQFEVRLPDGYHLVSDTTGWSDEGRVWLWQGELNQDQIFTLDLVIDP